MICATHSIGRDITHQAGDTKNEAVPPTSLPRHVGRPFSSSEFVFGMCLSARPAAPTPLRDLDPRLPPVHHCGARLGGDRIDVCHRVAVHPRLVIRPYFHLHDVPLWVQFPPNYAVQEHVLGVVDHGKEALDAIGGSDDVAVPVEFGPDGESRLGQRAVVAGEQLTTGPEEAAVAREGAKGGGRRGHGV